MGDIEGLEDFVDSVPERLQLAGGRYVDIKSQLNHGELEDMYAHWAPYITPGELAQLDRREVRTAKVLAYVIGWSLTNKGAAVPMSLHMSYAERQSTIANLHPDRFDEIHKAIEAHEAKCDAERARLKKTRDGLPADAPIAPSPSAPDGP
jgi:hypothetical protein